MSFLIFKRSLATLSKSTSFPRPGPTSNSGLASSLRFSSGEEFRGVSFGCDSTPVTSGEVVFTTSVVGYPESMTDPSYHGQILVFTQPIIGNYGVPAPSVDKFGLFKHFESGKIQVSGIIVNDYAAKYSHWNAIESLGNWCAREGIPAISGIDTRAVVTLLRDFGSKTGHISIGQDAIASPMPDYVSDSSNWIANVSSNDIKVYNSAGNIKIALIDCGAKQNIIRCLVQRGAQVTVFPHDFDFSSTLEQYDGVFISNGPGTTILLGEMLTHIGDPLSAKPTISTVSNVLSKSASMRFPIPVFGICMGHQVLGLAAGYKSYKLPFGNRGHNQPALDLVKGGCVITSQNHGYALDDSKTPQGWQTYFRNANDGSNEGIKHKTLPFSSVQFHPEAMGGPLDTQYLFEDFLKEVEAFKEMRSGVNVVSPFMAQSAKSISLNA